MVLRERRSALRSLITDKLARIHTYELKHVQSEIKITYGLEELVP